MSDGHPDSFVTTPAPPLLLSAGASARLCGLSVATWWRLHAAGRVPMPIRLGKRTLWRCSELTAWTGAGCPPRVRWQAQAKGAMA